jgi:hypothetical protein
MRRAVVALVLLVTGCAGRVADVDCVVDDDVGGIAFVGLSTGVVELFLPEASGGPLRCRPSVAACPDLEGCRGDVVRLPIDVTATLEVVVGATGPADGLRPQVFFTPVLTGDPAFALVDDPEATVALPGEPATLRVEVTPGPGEQQATLRFDDLFATNAPEDGPPLAVTLVVEGF